jgi:type I restriction enzyme S subunit
MAAYPTAPLRDVCAHVEYGYTASSTPDSSVGPRFLRITDIVLERLDWESVPFCAVEPKKLAKHRLRTGDIVIARTGATTGWAKYIKDPPEAVFASYLVRVRPASTVDARYIGFVVESSVYKDFIQQHMGGAAQPNANAQVLTSFEVPLPPLPIQQRIAGILSAYDELIENSQRRIQILDGMARALYREWFVHFRFPGHESVPRFPSPLGDIPEGWEVRRIGDVFKTVLGGTPSRARADFWEGGTVPWINSGKVNDLRITEASEYITDLALEKSAAKIMPKGTTVLAITGATLGQVSYLEIETTANQSVVGIVDPSALRSEWIYLTVRERIEGIIKQASGGAQQHINKEIVNDVQVAIPPDSLAKDFRQHVAPVFREVAMLLFQIQTLRRTRDLLLPRLLSGQIDLEAIPS